MFDSFVIIFFLLFIERKILSLSYDICTILLKVFAGVLVKWIFDELILFVEKRRRKQEINLC